MVEERFQGPEARYVQLADELSGAIGAGRYGLGDRLPSELELVQRYGLSRVTVRQALALLEKRGVVARKRGIGTFVAAPKARQDLGVLRGFYDTLVAGGLEPEVTLLDWRRVIPDEHVGAKLQQKFAMLAMRLYRVDGKPFAVTYVHLHPAAERLTRDEAAANPAYRILETLLGYKIDHAELTIRAESAGQGPGRLLEVASSEPILTLERVSFADSGEPLEHTVCYLRPDAYQFDITVRGALPITNGFRQHATATSKPREIAR